MNLFVEKNKQIKIKIRFQYLRSKILIWNEFCFTLFCPTSYISMTRFHIYLENFDCRIPSNPDQTATIEKMDDCVIKKKRNINNGAGMNKHNFVRWNNRAEILLNLFPWFFFYFFFSECRSWLQVGNISLRPCFHYK